MNNRFPCCFVEGPCLMFLVSLAKVTKWLFPLTTQRHFLDVIFFGPALEPRHMVGNTESELLNHQGVPQNGFNTSGCMPFRSTRVTFICFQFALDVDLGWLGVWDHLQALQWSVSLKTNVLKPFLLPWILCLPKDWAPLSQQVVFQLSYLSGFPFHFSSVVQLLIRVQLFATPWTAARQASLSFTICQSLLKVKSTKSVMPSNHLILSSPYPPAFSLSQHQCLFLLVDSSHQVAKVLELHHQSF